MTTIRRTAALLGLSAGVVISTGIPASATFEARTTAHTSALSTLVVAGPTNLKVERNCPTTQATLSWTASTSAGVAKNKVTGYSVLADVGGQPISAQVPANQTYYVYPTGWVAPGMTVPVTITVTTLTQYGWVKGTSLTTTVTTC